MRADHPFLRHSGALFGRQPFRTLKELTLVGYYTSEVGATRELRVNPMGAWHADVPYASLGHAWA